MLRLWPSMQVQAVDAPHRATRMPWQRLSYGFSFVVALGLCYFLVRMPLQVSDNVALIMMAHAESVKEVLASEINVGAAQFRPLLELTINLAFEIARLSGQYFLTFKAIQVAQVVALLLLFTVLLRVETASDFSAACVSVIAVVGMHTFFSTVYELYPINTYMTIVLCCVLALVLTDGPSAQWRDVAAGALFVLALFTLETGALVWVIITVGFAAGFRGVSIRGVAALTTVLIAYLALKFFVLSGELPRLDQVSASFGFNSYDQRQLVDTFSDRRLVFYGANIISSIATIVFAEPRAGLWRFVRTIVMGEAPPLAMVLNVVTSTASSILICWFMWTRRHAWVRLDFDRHDRFVLVFVAVVVANGVMSFPYTKDAMVSPAGLLFPLALFVAVREALRRLEREPRRAIVVVASCALGLLSLGWTLRAAAMPYGLFQTAYRYQQEWIHIDDWIVNQRLTHYNAEQRALIDQLRAGALSMEVPNPRLAGRWMGWAERLFDRP